jgi:putative transposase
MDGLLRPHELHAFISQGSQVNPFEQSLSSAEQNRRDCDVKWSSAYAHLAAQDDGLVRVKPMLDRMNDWAAYLSAECDEDTEVIKLHTRTGRPLGSTDFVEHLEAVTGKVLAPRRPGRKEKS